MVFLKKHDLIELWLYYENFLAILTATIWWYFFDPLKSSNFVEVVTKKICQIFLKSIFLWKICFRYRLGKIVDVKNESSESKTKTFLIQPIYVDSNNNIGSDQSEADKQVQPVSRPNIRLISPPWFYEYNQELNLKHHKEIQLMTMLHARNTKLKNYFGVDTEAISPEAKSNSIHKILSTSNPQMTPEGLMSNLSYITGNENHQLSNILGYQRGILEYLFWLKCV